jgi:hypothetical protein
MIHYKKENEGWTCIWFLLPANTFDIAQHASRRMLSYEREGKGNRYSEREGGGRERERERGRGAMTMYEHVDLSDLFSSLKHDRVTDNTKTYILMEKKTAKRRERNTVQYNLVGASKRKLGRKRGMRRECNNPRQ